MQRKGKRKPTGERSLKMPFAEAVGKAIGLHKEGRLDEAETIYRGVLEVQPENADALHFFGVLQNQRGHKEEAFEFLRRALASKPDYADARNNLANMLVQSERLEEAAAVYRDAIALRPDHIIALNNLGLVLRKMGRLDEAVAAFTRVIELTADSAAAHFRLANTLHEMGKGEEALATLRKGVALDPDPNSLRRLGALLYGAGRIEEAADNYRQWLAVEPDNPHPQHMLAACTGQGIPSRAGDAFVQRTFDRFADSFDEVLKALEYRAPSLVAAGLAEALGEPVGGLDVMDAGCGTGLCGPLLRPYARRLVGVEFLSPKMQDKAKERGNYDELVTAELAAYLAGAPGAFDIVASADTLVYFGALEEVSRAAATALRPGGCFAFTVEHARPEEGGAAEGYRLNPHGRYSHTTDYVRGVLTGAGFASASIAECHLRRELGRAVNGLLVTARKP